jgi:hypothetical protein
MKNLFLKFASLMSALLILTACTPEQSSFDVEEIPGKAKIMGTLSYDAGQSYSNGKYVQLFKPAANVKVYVKVSNASLSPNGKATGYTYYETTTNAEGVYQIEVPAVEVNGATTVKIAPEAFMATYSKVVSVNNNVPVYEKEEVLFKIAEETRTVVPNDIQIFDKQYTHNDRNLPEALPYNTTFAVKVGKPVYSKVQNENGTYSVSRSYANLSGKNVVVKVGDMYYGATTDYKGEATFVIPSKAKKWSTSISVDIPSYVASEKFVFYKREYNNTTGQYEINKYEISNGIYELNSNDTSRNVSFSGIDGVRSLLKVRMVYKPLYGQDTYGYDYSDWNNFEWSDTND